MHKLIAAFGRVLHALLADDVDVVFALRTEIVEPGEVFQLLLVGLEVGNRGERPLWVRPNFEAVQLIVFKPDGEITALRGIQAHHAAVVLDGIEDGFGIARDVDLANGAAGEERLQVRALQLVVITRIDLLDGEGKLLHVRIIDGAVCHINQDCIAVELVLLVPQDRVVIHI